jgi:hypothetical protein
VRPGMFAGCVRWIRVRACSQVGDEHVHVDGWRDRQRARGHEGEVTRQASRRAEQLLLAGCGNEHAAMQVRARTRSARARRDFTAKALIPRGAHDGSFFWFGHGVLTGQTWSFFGSDTEFLRARHRVFMAGRAPLVEKSSKPVVLFFLLVVSL